jgi:hypothetical protein
MSPDQTRFAKDEVLVLLGAGASVEAGIPNSSAMVQQIERALEGEWSAFQDLYNYVRSAIHYAEGIRGVYGAKVSYNIERLVVCLDELSRREEHPLYPFIGAWNPRLTQVAGGDFAHVSAFKTKILEKLRHEWIEISNYGAAHYFKGLIRLQKDLTYPLRVFTLNYDLCVEEAYRSEYNEYPERGFDRETRLWSHELLEESVSDRNFYLYKLHGSIDWCKDTKTNRLTFSDSTSKIRVEDGEMIFGTTYKLQYVDPFLFLVYQLRRLSLEARLLLVIGYGFGDDHINGILRQALRGGDQKRLVAVTWCEDSENDSSQRLRRFISKQLELNESDERLVVEFCAAKDFLANRLSLSSMAKHFPPEESLFDEIRPESVVEAAAANGSGGVTVYRDVPDIGDNGTGGENAMSAPEASSGDEPVGTARSPE